jgi:4-amino-4-deoxy-L-arabinose transferase-like glycosyltransferase
MPYLLLGSGALFAVLMLLNAIIQTIRKPPKLGFWHTWLAFISTLLPIGAIISNTQSETPDPLINQGAVLIAAVVIVLSLLILVIEARRAERNLLQSRGILGVGVGALVILSTFAVPQISNAIEVATSPDPTVVAQNATATIIAASATATFTNTPEPTLTPSRTPSATPSRTPAPPTPSITPFLYNSPTPVPTATLEGGVVCEGKVAEFNINMRRLPSTNAGIRQGIPAGAELRVIGPNEDASWWLVEYQALDGWVSNDVVEVGEGCRALPVQTYE